MSATQGRRVVSILCESAEFPLVYPGDDIPIAKIMYAAKE